MLPADIFLWGQLWFLIWWLQRDQDPGWAAVGPNQRISIMYFCSCMHWISTRGTKYYSPVSPQSIASKCTIKLRQQLVDISLFHRRLSDMSLWKSINNKMNNDRVPSGCFGFRVLESCMPACCHTVMSYRDGHTIHVIRLLFLLQQVNVSAVNSQILFWSLSIYRSWILQKSPIDIKMISIALSHAAVSSASHCPINQSQEQVPDRRCPHLISEICCCWAGWNKNLLEKLWCGFTNYLKVLTTFSLQLCQWVSKETLPVVKQARWWSVCYKQNQALLGSWPEGATGVGGAVGLLNSATASSPCFSTKYCQTQPNYSGKEKNKNKGS